MKLRRYLDELPSDMLERGDRLGLPLLLLPDDVAFDDLLNAVVGDVLQRQSTSSSAARSPTATLVSVVLDGGGLDELVDALARIIGGPALRDHDRTGGCWPRPSARRAAEDDRSELLRRVRAASGRSDSPPGIAPGAATVGDRRSSP